MAPEVGLRSAEAGCIPVSGPAAQLNIPRLCIEAAGAGARPARDAATGATGTMPGYAGHGDGGDQPRPKYANTAEIMMKRRVIKLCLWESEMITNHFPAVRKTG